ncbi:hypothetical protein [Haloarcula sp. JP-L23]|uniref:hypothetical protein n=1 Tax=Haloarcula sp. JP-L23 TaxID=2716717 RepID=UPI00140ECAC4|nr:hypothetical protein G9465_15900 [Haloarcula sp. JP-L23]
MPEERTLLTDPIERGRDWAVGPARTTSDATLCGEYPLERDSITDVDTPRGRTIV